MPMQETSFAFRFARLRHKFGASWMIINELLHRALSKRIRYAIHQP